MSTPANVIACLAVLVCTGSLAACGEDPPTAEPDKPAAGKSGGDGCPLAAADLSRITGLKWTMAERRTDHELEALPSVRATICVYTGPVGSYGDPMVFRTETVAESDAAAVRERFTGSCTNSGGSVRAASGGGDASVCESDYSTGDGIVADGVIRAYFVSVDKKDVAKLKPTFDEIIGVVKP